MSHSSSRPRAAGFTLMEVLVVLAALGMILWMAGQLLFPMRAAAERQRLQVEARQTARSAGDYASYVIRGASDMNDRATPRNPGTILTYLWKGPNPATVGAFFPTCPGTGCVQLSYNNVDQAATSLATDGSDIITLAVSQARTYPVLLKSASPAWPIPYDDASVQYWGFDLGCAPGAPAGNAGANDNKNLSDFKTLLEVGSTGKSLPLILVEPATGQWLTYRITSFRDGNNGTSCTVLDPNCLLEGVNVPCISVSATPSDPLSLNAPGGPETISGQPSVVVGSRFKTLRLCNGWLEEKDGFLDPDPTTGDGNCTPVVAAGTEFPAYVTKAGWSPLLPNVEDFQIAYVFANGETWNGSKQTLVATQLCDNGVPSCDAGASTPSNWDVRNIIAVRVTITARSSIPVTVGGKIVRGRPAAEDHNPGTAAGDTYYRYQVSVTTLLRNRTTEI